MQTPFLISIYLMFVFNLLIGKDFAIAQKFGTKNQPLIVATLVEGSTEGDIEDGDDCLDGCDYFPELKDGYHEISPPIIQARSPYFATVAQSPNDFDIISGDGIIEDMLNSSTLYHGEVSFQYIHDIDNGVELSVDEFDVDTNSIKTLNEMSGGGMLANGFEEVGAWTSNEFDNFIKVIQNATADSENMKLESSGDITNVYLDTFEGDHRTIQPGSGEDPFMKKSLVDFQHEMTVDGASGLAPIRFLPEEEFTSYSSNNTEESSGDVDDDIISVRQAFVGTSLEIVGSDPMSVESTNVGSEIKVQQHPCWPKNPCSVKENCRVKSGSDLKQAICLCNCMNGGACLTSDGSCDCPVGFTGRNCELYYRYERVERSLPSGRSFDATGESKDALSSKFSFIIISSLAAVFLSSCLSFLIWKLNKRQSSPTEPHAV